MRKNIFKQFCLLTSLLLLATLAQARGTAGSSDWTIQLGAFGLLAPEYQGADDYELQVLPLLDIRWREQLFFNPRRGLGMTLLRQDNLKLALSLGYSFGRDEDDSSELKGLGDVDGGLTANAFADYRFGQNEVSLHYQQQISGESTGYQLHLSLGYRYQLGERTLIKPALNASYASSDYLEAYFGVSPVQAVTSALPVYSADAGLKSAGLQLLAIHSLDRHWGLQALVGYDRLLDEAADSPLVKEENQYRFLTGVSYRF